MITYDMSQKGKSSLYDFLYSMIKEDIESGKLTAKEKLPSKRMLAHHLGISVITVEHAYSQLIDEGYITSKEKRGYFVNELDISMIKRKNNNENENKREALQRKYFCDFKNNSINPDFFPFSTWSKLMREVLSEQYTNLLDPVPYNGIYDLRKQISEYLYQSRGIKASPANIIIGSGTENLYSSVIQLLGRENTVAIEDPSYPKISRIYQKHGVKIVYLNLDRDGISITSLKNSTADILHFSPSHQFPTGTVTPIGRRQEILKWAYEKKDRYIIEDEYDSEFRFSGRPIPALRNIDSEERVIYINTFTKTLAPSIRISYMVLPEMLAKKYGEEMGFYSCTVPSFEQYALARFIERGHFERHLNRMKNIYKIQRDKIINAVKNSNLIKISEISEENSGLHFILKIKTEMGDNEMIEAAEEADIKITCMSEYSKTDKIFEHAIIVNYSCIDAEKVTEAAERLYQAFIK